MLKHGARWPSKLLGRAGEMAAEHRCHWQGSPQGQGKGQVPQPKRHVAATQEPSFSREGERTQNNVDTMPHSSAQEPEPYLATHLLCSRCWQPAGQAPNLLPPRPQRAPGPCHAQRHGQGHPSCPRAAKPCRPLAACLVSPLFPNELFSPTSQQESLTGSHFTRLSHITYSVI